MKIIIIETGEQKTLSLIDPHSGVNCVEDIIGNSGAFDIGDIAHDPETGLYSASADVVNWWINFLSQEQEDQDRLYEIEQSGTYTVEQIRAAVENTLVNVTDYNDYHAAYLELFEILEG